MRRPAAQSLIVFAAWTALAIFFAASTSLTYIAQGRPALWSLTATTELAQWWIWAALTPIILWTSRRYAFARGHVARALAVHLPLSLVVAFVTVTIESRVRVWVFGVRPFLPINNLALKFLLYWTLVGAAHAVDQYGRTRARAAEREAQLGHAQIELLRTQLQPQFLFNALKAIAELVHEDPDRADQMVGRLSDLLRTTLDAGDRPVVTLGEEIDLARQYLAIQEARFGSRLRVSIDIPPDCQAVLVPHVCLQPLIENAVRHGLAPRPLGGTVRIEASRRNGAVVISVEDDGVGWTGEAPREGLGLLNTRARLRSLYGDQASIALVRREGTGAVARVTLPHSDRAVGSRPS
jgi:two-component system LytT family sensor kinase